MTLAATFFGGLNVAADTVGRQALDVQLVNTPVDVELRTGPGPSGGSATNIPSSSFLTLVNGVKRIDGVQTAESFGSQYSTNGSYPSVRAIQDDSTLYSHFTLVSGRMTLQLNETLINADSASASAFPLGRRVLYGIGSYYNGTRWITPYNMTLTVVGTVSLDALALSTLGVSSYYSPNFQGSGQGATFSQQSVFITSWEKTFVSVVDFFAENSFQCNKSYCQIFLLNNGVNVYLDRNRLISPFGIENSISQIQQIEARVSVIAQQYGFNANDRLVEQLQGFSQEIFLLRVQFTVVSIPVFFLAWYVGRTVSLSSFNLRKKEIGLLLTRGFTRTQLFRQFLTEGMMVGIVAGITGIALAYALNPTFVWALGGGSGGTAFLTFDTFIVTVLFTMILTLFSIFSPARQAAAMDPAQSLKEYVYLEDAQPRRKRGAILAFSLGLYELTLLLLGINYQNIGRYVYGANFFLAIVLIVAAVLSLALTYIGPFLFLYGAAQLSTGPAQRFHRSFARLSRKMIGEIAVLASKSVFRNPRRVASLVFIVALIVGYSVWVIGDLASQQDYNYRQAEVQIGSDIRISGINSIANATQIAAQLRNWNNITGATPEADFTAFTLLGNLQVKAIDPLTWRQGAYYETSWFTGNLDGVFTALASNNETMVLDHGVASYYSIRLQSNLALYGTTSVSILSFFGPDYSQTASGPFGSFHPEGWSFVPIGLIGNGSEISPSVMVLAKGTPGLSLDKVAQSIQRAYPSFSVSTPQFSSLGVGGVISTGGQNVLRLGIAFAGLAAGLGVGTVAYTGYRAREKEITMIAVRGLSYRQLAGLLITEFLPLIVYALVLAVAVGLIVVWGDAQGQNSLNQDYLAILAGRRIVFPPWAVVNILAIIGLILAGVFLPAIFAAKKDLAKMNRTVRFA